MKPSESLPAQWGTRSLTALFAKHGHEGFVGVWKMNAELEELRCRVTYLACEVHDEPRENVVPSVCLFYEGTLQFLYARLAEGNNWPAALAILRRESYPCE